MRFNGCTPACLHSPALPAARGWMPLLGRWGLVSKSPAAAWFLLFYVFPPNVCVVPLSPLRCADCPRQLLIPAHAVILASCSEYFRVRLLRWTRNEPLAGGWGCA